MGGVILFGVLLSFVLLVALGIYTDWKDYNHGKCKKCGKKLVLFDIASGGSRGYRCPDWHGGAIWISFGCVDKGGDK